jgi:chaperonin GroES
MNFRPLDKRVVVERVEQNKTTVGGIIIPDNAKEKPQMGKIVAVSKKVEEKNEIKVGDSVLFGKYSGTEITIDGKEYLVLATTDILGIL